MRTKKAIYISVERHAVSGAWLVTGLLNDGHGDYYHTVRYDGYTRSEAVQLFTDRFRQLLANA